MNRINNGAWWLVAPAVVLFAVVGIAPLMATLNYSFQDSFAGDNYFWVGTYWYEELFKSSAFWGAFGRTLLFAAITISLQFIIGIFVARKLYFRQVKAQMVVALIALPLLTPWIVVGFIWRHLVNPEAGLIGASLSLFNISPDLNSVWWVWATIIAMDLWHWTSLVVILCYAGYLSIPGPYFQAARIDGASKWATFRYIELPKLKNVLVIALLLRLADSLMIYTEPLMISRGGPHVSSTFMSQKLIQTAMLEFNLGAAGAISMFYLVVMILIAWILFRYIRSQNV